MAHAWKACWVQALGGSNPPSSATEPRDRFRFRGFCCLWRRVLWVPLVFRAPSCPAAREIATREPAARKCRSRSPPVPSGPSGALHTSGAWSLMCGSARRLEARPGPAAAHRHRGQAMQPSPPSLGVLWWPAIGRSRAAEPRPRPLRLRGLRRSLRPGVQPGPRPSQRASIGAGPSRCSSIRPSMPSR